MAAVVLSGRLADYMWVTIETCIGRGLSISYLMVEAKRLWTTVLGYQTSCQGTAMHPVVEPCCELPTSWGATNDPYTYY